MSARPDTWMPMYWGDYARDTGNLNNAGHGAYLMLIKHYWCTGLPLTDDDDELWRTACCDSKKEWLKLRKKIVRLFVSDGGILRHRRIDREIAKTISISTSKAQAGKKGAEKRWHTNGTPIADAISDPLFCHKQTDAPSQPPSPSPKEKETSLRDVRPRKTQVPEDWQPDAEGVAYAKTRGLTTADLEAFRDHYRGEGKPMVNWNLVWKNWCRNARKFGTVLPGLSPTEPKVSV